MSEPFGTKFVQSEMIGEGAMGKVYKATDPRLSRTVALKLLQSELTDSQAARFANEARITGSLEHPSIPPIYEYGETEDKTPYFALKLLDGETLEEILKRLKKGDKATHQAYSFPERVRIAIKLCEALEYAHAKNILHRDIKPDNVMLGSYGEVWLLDWGVAGPPSTPEGDIEERLTEEATFMGTLSFAAPGQLAGIYSPATDQYALGAVLYEFFCLQPAHPGKNRMEVMTAVLQNIPKAPERFPRSDQGRVPREISVLILRMLQKKPEDRFESMTEVKEALRTIAGGDIVAICPHTLAKKTMFRIGRNLDNHNYWLMPLIMLWLAFPLVALGYWLSLFIFPGNA